MNMKKKVLSVMLAVTMAVSLTVPAMANTNDSTDRLNHLAAVYISEVHDQNETIYSGIQDFYTAVYEECPSISDLEIAKYVMDYTGQSYAGLSEESILEALDFVEVTTTDQILWAKANGTVVELTPEEAQEHLENPVSPPTVCFSDDGWIPSDGYVNIKVSASKQSKTKYGTPFVLNSTVSWLKYPTYTFTDTLAIAYTGSFDDSYITTSTFTEQGTCSRCQKKFSYEGTEKFGPDASNKNPHHIERSDLLELDFGQANAVGTKVKLQDMRCLHGIPGGTKSYTEINNFKTTLSFKILANSTGEARAMYIHTKLGGTVSVGGQVNGTSVLPVVSGKLSIVDKKYSANPVTLRCD